jgi:hypothetical protein
MPATYVSANSHAIVIAHNAKLLAGSLVGLRRCVCQQPCVWLLGLPHLRRLRALDVFLSIWVSPKR